MKFTELVFNKKEGIDKIHFFTVNMIVRSCFFLRALNKKIAPKKRTKKIDLKFALIKV